ncbi:hypothetical protein KD050_21130 [Psychrobacillus sp. INOP01]|uniref:hypothetical protein n=1 Tax=Psychrobacillus sp. INOP01 TaxID=2829187 RepID=UPI001BA4F834|nr:hypothetical protein [Psychrobacillus sp. INOP01]QUG41721.1 hypothetical protein KD050_21130 [Psychrobacillus sp. INOP01]
MGIRYIYFVFIIVILLITAGCSNEKLAKYEYDNNKKVVMKTEEVAILTPPKLTISVEGNKILAGQGSYFWSKDNDDGTGRRLNVDAGPPPEIAGKELSVKSQSEVHLVFEEVPSVYQVRIWESDNEKAIAVTDNTFTITQNKEIVIYSVVANWEHGTATYAFSLNVE